MIYKRGKYYWYKFVFNGELIRESTKQSNDKIARNMESDHRARLAREQKEQESACERLQCSEVLRCHECEKLFNAEKVVRKSSNVFCGAKCAATWEKNQTMPTLRDFLERRFVPDAETRHKDKALTLRYYKQGSDLLLNSTLADMRLDELTDEHAQRFASEHGRLSASGINRGLRTLRRALNLAYRWGQLDKPIKVVLAKGEKQRDRVLSDKELTAYLAKCPQPWRDCATMIADEGMRPSEVFALQWPHLLLNGTGGLIHIVSGKSKAARRVLPMTPRVYGLLKARHKAAGEPTEGWVYPSGSAEGHFNGNAAKDHHTRALTDSGVAPFPPYVLRHTALTKLAAKGADAHTLARIAGHSSIVITMRYVHPQADAIERAFLMAYGKAARKRPVRRVGTKVGTIPKAENQRLLNA